MKCKFEGVEVYYEVFGTGEDDTPLVFLHGWGGSTKSFEYFAKAMCSCRKVVLIDLPPFGNSTESKNVWTVEKYAQCVLEILNQIGAKRCDIVAHSFGGRVAILHEKELVLNQDDTKNILTVVQLVRQIAANSYLDTLTPGVINNSQESFNTVQQQVTIDASFPSVSDRNEIEQAFNNLVNRAAQHAFKNKK